MISLARASQVGSTGGNLLLIKYLFVKRLLLEVYDKTITLVCWFSYTTEC